jgi:glycosyltransferase involved in cell wall biosynthesis
VVESLQTGGLERLVHDLVIGRGGGSTSVACLESIGPFGEALRDRGLPVELLGKQRGFLATLWRLRGYLRRVQPDVVHCHNLFPFLIGSLAARLSGGIPVVMTKHGIKLPDRGIGRRLVRALLRRDYAVSVSPEAARLMTAWMRPGSRPVRYIANGIATAPYDNLPTREAARAQLGLPAASFIVGIVSRVALCKGHLVLLDAFARVLSERPGAVLLIVGTGPELPAVSARIQELGSAGPVIVLGERRDIPCILAALDVLCLPSEMEGMPMTVLEAMAARLPVVASNVGGIPEIVDHGRTGLLVPPRSVDDLAAALLQVAGDPARAREMGRAGRRKLLQAFSLDNALAAYEQCYREALLERTGTSHSLP